MTAQWLVRLFLVLSLLVALCSSAAADEWVVQEDPDSVQFTGCWSVFPTNYYCDGEPYLIDGDDETGSFSYMHNEDAVLEVVYWVPTTADTAEWAVVFAEGGPATVQELRFTLDPAGLPEQLLSLRITVHNSGSVYSPYHFDWHDGDDWVVLHSGTSTGGYVSAIIFEERVHWFLGDEAATSPSSWSLIKAIFR